ncbi:MAG: hypothetical protein V2A54_04955 [Bacteroidota bacterium]
MRNIILITCLAFLFSCNESSEKKTDNTTSDSTKTPAVFNPGDTLENLLKIKDIAELKEIYGEKNVTEDTIWGGEGMFFVGTYLFGRTPNAVVFNWKDTLKKATPESIVHRALWDTKKEKHILTSRWKSRTGIGLGTTLTKLNEINGKPYKFYGLGWDYGGMLISWEKGKLDGKGVYVTMGAEDVSAAMQKDYTNVCGDSERSSSTVSAKKLNPVVFEVTVNNNKN